jgi:hypothetical protein
LLYRSDIGCVIHSCFLTATGIAPDFNRLPFFMVLLITAPTDCGANVVRSAMDDEIIFMKKDYGCIA